MAKPHKLPNGRWRIRWIDADGKRQSNTFATYSIAEKELRRTTVERDDDVIRRKREGLAALTVSQAFERFMAERKPDPHNTKRRFDAVGRRHQHNLDMHIAPHLESVRLCDLTPPVLRQWLGKLADTKTARPGERNAAGKTLSASTIRAAVTTLRQICKANDVNLVVPLAESLRQKRRRTRPKALQCIEDVRAMIAACHEPWFRVAAAIACYCGARLGEVASLRWRHIGESTVTIALSWEGPLKARYEDDPDGARVVALAPELAEVLKQWRAMTKGRDDDHVVLRGVPGGDDARAVKRGIVRPLAEGMDDLASKTRTACKRAGVTPMTFHSLRASYATLVADQGLPVSKLAAALGHTDVRTTSIYIRPESASVALDPRSILGGHGMATQSAEPATGPN